MNDNNNTKKQRQLSAIMFTDMVGYSAVTQKNESLAIDLLIEHRKLLRPIFSKHSGSEVETVVDVYHIILPWEKGSEVKNKNFFSEILNKETLIYTGTVIALLLVFLFFWNQMQTTPDNKRNDRIAVLPLNNISKISEDDYFADGLTEELISQLAHISGLNVIARTSVMKYKNTEMNIEEIGNELDVGTILQGSVRTASEKARINVQLIDVKTQQHLWSEDYDRELKDIFAIQSDIALRIARALKIQLVAIEKQQIEKMGTGSTEAYRLYLLGRFYLNKRTEKSIFRSLEYFRDAIKSDPDYALSYVGIADCYALIGGAGYGFIPQDEVILRAKEAVSRALAIDESLADAYNSLAYINFRLEWNWEEAEHNFKKAIELKPGYAKAYERYAFCLALLGRLGEALPLMLRAQDLDPLSVSVGTGVGRIYHFSRQDDKAIEQYKKTLEIAPDYAETVFALGLSYNQKKMYKEAISELKSAINLSNGRPIIEAALASVYAASGLRSEAVKIYTDLVGRQSDKKISPYYAAIVNGALGNRNDAIDSLYTSYDEHFGLMVYINIEPLLDPVRSDPKFIQLLRMMGFE